MSRYRKIDPRIWTDERFRKLGPDEQRVAIYILTAQTNRVGIFSFSPGKAVEDLETLPQTFAKRFKTVTGTLKWEWDEKARVLYLPTWWKYNHPENANNMIGNLKDLADLPQSPLLERFFTNTAYLSDTLIETFTQTLAKHYPKRSPTQEQEQEQEQEQKQEQEQDAPPTPPPGGNGSSGVPVVADTQATAEWIMARWNEIQGVEPFSIRHYQPALGVGKKLAGRIQDHPDRAWWLEYFDTIRKSKFLVETFHPVLDWVLGPLNMQKILQGNYIRTHQTKSKPKTAFGRLMDDMRATEHPQPGEAS